MVKTHRLVVIVSADALRAVLCNTGQEIWRHEIPMPSMSELPIALQALLSCVPVGRRLDMFVGFAQPWARLRILPLRADEAQREEVARLLDSHVEEFFLGDANCMRATFARVSDDSWKAAAFDRDIVRTVSALSDGTRLRLIGVFPVGAPMEPETPDITWRTALQVATDGQHELMWLSEPTVRGRRASGVLRALLAIAAVLSGVVAYGAPALVLEVQTRSVERSVRTLDARMRRLEAAVGDEAVPTAVMERAERTARESASIVDLLVRVFDSLPDSAALTSIRLDSAGAVLTVVAPPTQSALRSVIGVRGAESARLVGPVATDVIDGVEVHRATVQWRLASHLRASGVGARP